MWALRCRLLLFALALVVLGAAITSQAQAAVNDTTLISRQSDSSGGPADGSSTDASVSQDGRYVAFVSTSRNLVPDDVTGYCFNGGGISDQIYLRDTQTGATSLVSRATDSPGVPGVAGDACSAQPSISANGRYVAFTSSAVNFDSDDPSYGGSIYLRDVVAGTTKLVSREDGAGGTSAQGDSAGPSVSDDGRYVSFNSWAGNLSPDKNPLSSVDVYVRDMQANTTYFASRATGASGEGQNNRTWKSELSGDGRHVVWRSWADNLSSDENGCIDVYVRNLDTDTTELASRASGTPGNPLGEGADGTTSNPVISYSGRYVAFSSFGDNLSNDDYDNPARDQLDHCMNPNSGDYGGDNDIFVRDMASNTTTLVSRADGINGAGAAPASSAPNQGYDPSAQPAISADGRHVAYESISDNLSNADNDAVRNIYVRDILAGTTQLVSRASGAGAGADADALAPSISDDGTVVSFSSAATNLSAVDLDPHTDIFSRTVGGPPTATETKISGYRLKLTDSPASALKRRLSLLSKDAQLTSLAELPGTGATLRIVGTGIDNTYQLPAAKWRVSGTRIKYADSLSSGPVRRAELHAGYLRIDGLGPQIGHSLASNPGPVAVVFSTGLHRYCLEFGGRVTYKAGRTYRASGAPAPATCPN